MDDGDLYGYFLPHNIWHCYSLKIALWAAGELNLECEKAEIQAYYDDAITCLLDILERGSIKEEDGTRWIPGVPGKTCGSRWGAANAISPCGLLDPHHPLADGTLNKLEKELSKGGLPLNLGWMPNGLWVSIAIDNLSYTHLARGEEDKAEAYLYPTLNHGTPLYSWCEERMPEPGAEVISGDRQHLWTPVSMVRFIRDMLLMEESSTLHITRAIPRWWMGSGKKITVKRARTHWGIVNFLITRDTADRLILDLEFKDENFPENVIFHIRIPDGIEKITLDKTDGAKAFISKDKIMITPVSNNIKIYCSIK